MYTTQSPVSTTNPSFLHAKGQMTRTLLNCGILAGPLYLLGGLAQAFTRPGFDISRHPLSLLSNGDLGWIQVTNFLVNGLLVILAAIGMRQALTTGVGRLWAPILLALYGVGMIGGAIFKADPVPGFPVGTPADTPLITTQGILHFATGGTGFLCLTAACIVFAQRFSTLQQKQWASFSLITSIVFLASFAGIATGGGSSLSLLGFWIGIVLAWSWLSLLSLKLRSELRGG